MDVKDHSNLHSEAVQVIPGRRNILSTDDNFATRGRVEHVYAPQQSGFAAPRCADHGDHVALMDDCAGIFQRCDIPERFADISKLQQASSLLMDVIHSSITSNSF